MTYFERAEEAMRAAAKNGCGVCICDVCKYGGEIIHACTECDDSYSGFKLRGWNDTTYEGDLEAVTEDVKPDPVNRPAHYTSGGIECINAMQAAFGDEAVKDFCLCNAFKYLWRHREKGGLEDLKKARWYLNRLIREMEVTGDE